MWRCHTKLEKFAGDPTLEERESGLVVPIEEPLEIDGNLLVIGGASVQWQTLIGNGGAGALQYFNNANAHIGVGGGAGATTAAADTQTDLQGASKTRKAMDSTYPQHTDTTGTAGSKSIVFRSTFATGDANYTWDEWGVFNAAAASRMLNRKVEALGTKTSAATWVLTITLSLA
jgi:hypothetical protein